MNRDIKHRCRAIAQSGIFALCFQWLIAAPASAQDAGMRSGAGPVIRAALVEGERQSDRTSPSVLPRFAQTSGACWLVRGQTRTCFNLSAEECTRAAQSSNSIISPPWVGGSRCP